MFTKSCLSMELGRVVSDVHGVSIFYLDSMDCNHASTVANLRFAAPRSSCLPSGRALVHTVPFVVTKRSS